ncbi:PAS domain-containing protein [Ramlibacter sp. G-1-2-2]|uniref:PAS domain-containing protein n=1 Tax=Ramlibacter agri TaxID=2728837 RepID=A0A848H9Y8_9BURK|nr:PAS domain-containing methyl-accepting chemotaxis protein [Ramlibacter agri]NML46261.1 PAS domain-containing protein [Ramlibacter agri]
MRNNQPVTQQEHRLADDAIIMSITDTESRIVYVNPDFIQASGFEREELTGEFHNLVRHPDMPREAFADLWATIRGNESWTGMIKNRRKNGDHYWVRANATPITRDGHITGYTSVRVTPTRQEVEAAEALYARLRNGTARGTALRKGVAVRTGLLAWTSWLQVMPLRWRIRLAALGGLALAVAAMLAGGLPSATVAQAGALALLGAFLNCWMLEAQVARPLQRILAQAELSARGQACAELHLNRIDEIGMLARATTQANLNLRSLVKDVVKRSHAVDASGTGLHRASQELAARTEHQASALEESAASMEELAAAVKQNAERAQRAMDLVRSASETTLQGGAAVGAVADTMQGIRDSAGQIANIIGLIDDIAFQTNILALNAAVEAARAGEQGRGFAVVSAEVRALARRSAEAAKQIKSIIAHSLQQVEQGAHRVQGAAGTTADVVESVRRVSRLMEEISAACAEQSTGVAQVGDAVVQMDQATQQNAQMVQDVAGAVAQLALQTGDLVLAVGVFAGAAHGAPAARQRPAAPTRAGLRRATAPA